MSKVVLQFIEALKERAELRKTAAMTPLQSLHVEKDVLRGVCRNIGLLIDSSQYDDPKLRQALNLLNNAERLLTTALVNQARAGG